MQYVKGYHGHVHLHLNLLIATDITDQKDSRGIEAPSFTSYTVVEQVTFGWTEFIITASQGFFSFDSGHTNYEP